MAYLKPYVSPMTYLEGYSQEDISHEDFVTALYGPGLYGRDYYAFSDPLDVAGLRLWLDADDSTTITKDGSDRVSQWNDKSGHGHNATQGISLDQPLFVANSQNSRDGIVFDDGSDEMVIGSVLDSYILGDDKQFTWFFVANSAGAGSLVVQWASSGNQRAFFIDIPTTPLRMAIYRTGVAGQIRAAEGDGVATGLKLLTVKYDGTLDTNNGLDRFDFSINEIAQTETLTNNLGSLGGIHNSTSPLTIGGGIFGDGMDGALYELLFYNRLTSAIETSKISDFLNERWAI